MNSIKILHCKVIILCTCDKNDVILNISDLKKTRFIQNLQVCTEN